MACWMFWILLSVSSCRMKVKMEVYAFMCFLLFSDVISVVTGFPIRFPVTATPDETTDSNLINVDVTDTSALTGKLIPDEVTTSSGLITNTVPRAVERTEDPSSLSRKLIKQSRTGFRRRHKLIENPSGTAAPVLQAPVTHFFEYEDSNTEKIADIYKFIGEPYKRHQSIPVMRILQFLAVGVLFIKVFCIFYHICCRMFCMSGAF